MRPFILIVGFLAAACAPAGSGLSKPPQWGTEAAWLVPGGCGVIGAPPTDKRRVDVQLQVEHGDAWVLIGNNRLHAERPTCFALDVPVGEHPVTIRARSAGGSGGVGLNVEIGAREAGGPTKVAFALHCGAPGRCDTGTLHAWNTAVNADRRRLGDPCAAAQMRGVQWKSGPTSDGVHPEDVEITFSMRVGTSLADVCAPTAPWAQPPPEQPPQPQPQPPDSAPPG